MGSLSDRVQRHIRELRKERGLTQEQVCELAGVSVDAVTRIESGTRTPTLPTLERLARALDVSPAQLLDPSIGIGVPPSRSSTSSDRIAALLEGEPPDVQRAIETIVATVLSVSRR